MSGGLLIGGQVVPVPGLTIYNPRNAPWCTLSTRDYRPRQARWVRQLIFHTTKGRWPQHVIVGAGPGGKDKAVADFWKGDPTHSAAHLVIDNDGSVACLCDLATIAAYHATWSNDWSIGIELYQEHDGGIYDAAYVTAHMLALALCYHFDIPLQIPSRSYNNAPITRMIHGGPDMVGIFGHRDNTSDRGRGDPGDELYARMQAIGAEPLNFDTREDIAVWRQRQRFLNAIFGTRLKDDGLAGPATIKAMRRCGYQRGQDIPA